MGKFDGILLMSDLDGTLCDGGKVSAENCKAIAYFQSEGGLFSIATGRMHYNLEETVKGVYELVNAVGIMCNGTYFYDFCEKKLFMESFMDNAVTSKAIACVLKQGFDGFIRGCDRNGYFVDSVDKRGRELLLGYGITAFVELPYCEWNAENWYKVCFDDRPDALACVERLLREKFPGAFEYNRSRPTLLEIQRNGVNKSTLFEPFKQYYRDKGRELTVYVCGDNENDIEILKKADVAVCPSNAIDDVKAICDRCLCSNNEGVVADLIYSLKNFL